MSTPIPDEQAALLRAISESPDDDTPRLVYADWLQEHGDEEQAKFILESINAARTGSALEGDNGWVYRLGLGIDVGSWERGFPAEVNFHDFSNFEECAERLLALVPVRRVTLFSHRYQNWDAEEWEQRDEEDEDAEPTPPWVKWDEYTVRHLVSLPNLARLAELVLKGFSDVGLWGLFEPPNLSGLNLKYLGLPSCRITLRDAQNLASSPLVAGLVELDLSTNSIGIEGARAILESPYLRQRLKKLWLARNPVCVEPDGDEVLSPLREWLGDGLQIHEWPK